ncbi:hypothetical protein WJX74_005869 [Apatococcus lobatus]|uniref:Uncharacterized protein n=1 Tax=Apatococcus lobatus TaxID=904363 RepID=A0AAW1RJQ1_9CHLO
MEMELRHHAPLVRAALKQSAAAHDPQRVDLARPPLVASAMLSGWSPIAHSAAAEQGDLQLLQQLLALQPACMWDEDISFQAAAHGRLRVLQWLLTQNGPINVLRCTLQAATAGHSGVLIWLRQMFPSFFEPFQAMQLAASAGDLKAIQSLRCMDPPCAWDESTLRAAAREGHLHILEWMHQQSPHCHWDVSVPEEAALHGQLQVLQWLHQQQLLCNWITTICQMAAQGGHLDMLVWLQSLQPASPLDATVSAAAAANGQLRVLQWLRDQDLACPWDKSSCHAAAAGGHLEVLQWLRDPSHGQPCPWDRGVAISATISGHLPILQWIHEVAPFQLIDHWAAITACTYQQPHILEWLLRKQALSDSSLQDLCNHPGQRRFLMQSLHMHGLMNRQSRESLLVPTSMGDFAMVQLALPELKARGLVLEALQWSIAYSSGKVGKLDGSTEREAGYWRDQAPMFDYLQTARLLLEQLPHLSSTDQHQLCFQATMSGSIIPVQLAYMNIQPRIEWGPKTHSLAAANGSPALLRWLLAEPSQPSCTEVNPACSDSRMLLLVHGHGWSVPDSLRSHLLAAELRHYAFYGVVQRDQQRVQLQQGTGLSLGHLPQSIIEKIACMADIDFSWAYPL